MPSPHKRHRIPPVSVEIEAPADIGLAELISMTPQELEERDDIEITVERLEDD